MKRSRSSRQIGLLVVGLLGLVAWRLETPWRRLQAEALDHVQETSRAELAVLRAASAEELRFLEGEVEVARDRLATREIADAERRLLALERRLLHAGSGREAEGLEEMVLAERRKQDEVLSELRAAETELTEARKPIELLEDRVDSLGGFTGWLRGVPVLRALGAGVRLRETVPAGTGRPERCVTCHLSMARDAASLGISFSSATESWMQDEDLGRLFLPHPRPDLHLSAGSPHPLGELGCTSCHGGDGAATDFEAAGHGNGMEQAVPSFPIPFSAVPRPILAGAQVESSCVACHNSPWLESAPTQEAGRLLVRSMACEACHETGRGDLEPTVPSLVDLPSRKRRAWVATFLADPSGRKPTFMPRFWDGAEPAERDAEIAAVVAWLWPPQESADRSADEVLDGGADPALESEGPLAAEGSRLWRDIGCAACHLVESKQREALLGSQRLRGPSLASVGAEVRPGSLPDLLRGHDPGYVWRDGEIEALSAYLAGLVGESDVPSPAPPVVSSDTRDELLRRRLAEVTTHEDSAAWMDRLDDESRTLLLGRLAVRRYRCGSCHRLAERPPVGPAVLPSQAAASSLLQVGEYLDAGLRFQAAHVEVNNEGLPSWRLAPAESEALEVQLAGWREGSLGGAAEMRPPVETRLGRDLVARHGCRACHALTEGEEPPDVFGRHGAPPSLAGVGEKLRADWIFHHLDDPDATALRPWAGLRMPRFELTPAERSAVGEYFARRSGLPMLSPNVGVPTASERALGEAVYRVLLCESCHGEESALRAPDYRVAGDRLRARWLRDWLLAPHEDAGMPTPFPPRNGRPDASYLLATLDAPMFEVHRARLERFFPDRGELERVFDDPTAVADALALHVLTLAEE